MILEENERKIEELESKLISLDPTSNEFKDVSLSLHKLKEETYSNLTAWDRVTIARSAKRITDFYELHGDQYYADDQSIIAGIGYLGDIPVTVIGQAKGTNLNESIKRNFGMTSPEGFRKALRLAHQAEKFNRPIITIVDTSGAYPGRGAEERGQARAIARNLMEFSTLKVPVIAIVLSEGGSGGALALTVSDYIYMFENAVYSVLSPEGFASILFKDTIKVEDAAQMMKMTSHDLHEYGIVDEIIKEPAGGIRFISDEFIKELKSKLIAKINELQKMKKEELLENRYQKYRKIS